MKRGNVEMWKCGMVEIYPVMNSAPGRHDEVMVIHFQLLPCGFL